jgi:hypothetical protein
MHLGASAPADEGSGRSNSATEATVGLLTGWPGRPVHLDRVREARANVESASKPLIAPLTRLRAAEGGPLALRMGLVDALSDLLNTQIDSATLGCERYQNITTG